MQTKQKMFTEEFTKNSQELFYRNIHGIEFIIKSFIQVLIGETPINAFCLNPLFLCSFMAQKSTSA